MHTCYFNFQGPFLSFKTIYNKTYWNWQLKTMRKKKTKQTNKQTPNKNKQTKKQNKKKP